MESLHMRKEKKKLVIFIFLLGLASLVIVSQTQRSICVIYNTTGLPCPSCGMTRAFLHLAKLDFAQAFHYHPLFLLVPVLFYSYLKGNQKLLIAIGLIFIIVWIIRMVLYFPCIEPMNYNNSSIFGIIIDLIKERF